MYDLHQRDRHPDKKGEWEGIPRQAYFSRCSGDEGSLPSFSRRLGLFWPVEVDNRPTSLLREDVSERTRKIIDMTLWGDTHGTGQVCPVFQEREYAPKLTRSGEDAMKKKGMDIGYMK
jgi:hypothetical protein